MRPSRPSGRPRSGGREMNMPNRRPLIPAARAATALLLLALCYETASAAPAPFERSNLRIRPLCHDDLVGTWTMSWGSYRCPVTLSAFGHHVCHWGGLLCGGSWSLDANGRCWITETTTPADVHSWRSYAVPLDPATLTGRVAVGSPGTDVRLVRVLPAK